LQVVSGFAHLSLIFSFTFSQKAFADRSSALFAVDDACSAKDEWSQFFLFYYILTSGP
jgi:hypothetical protein